MRVQAPFNPRQARPGQTLKPSYGPGAMNEELRANATLARVTGGILPSQERTLSAVLSAIAENERLVEKSQAKERLASRQYKQAQSAAQSRNVVSDARQREFEREQEVIGSGSSVLQALYTLEKNYGYGRVIEKPVSPSTPTRVMNLIHDQKAVRNASCEQQAGDYTGSAWYVHANNSYLRALWE